MEETDSLTIKERLLGQFVEVRKQVGPNWKSLLAKSDPFYDTRKGAQLMIQVSNSVCDTKRASVDRIEKVIIALKKVVSSLTP